MAVIVTMVIGVQVRTAPKASAASNPSPQTHVYSLNFTTTNQNMWGSGDQEPGSLSVPIIPTAKWNKTGTTGSTKTICYLDVDSDCGSGDNDVSPRNLDKDTVLCVDLDTDCYDSGKEKGLGDGIGKLSVKDGTTKCADLIGDNDCSNGTSDNDAHSADLDNDTKTAKVGGSIAASTSGQVGLDFNLTGIKGGTVAVTAPEQVKLTVDPPIGQQVTIHSSWSPQSGGAITSTLPQTVMSLSGTVGVQAALGGSACVGTCSSVTILRQGSGIKTQTFTTGPITDTKQLDIHSVPFAKKLFQTKGACVLSGWGGYLGAPNAVLGTTTQSTGGQLSAQASDKFVQVDLNLAQWANCVSPNPVPLSASPPLPHGLKASYTLLFAGVQPNLSEDQRFTFVPQPEVSLAFGTSLPYVVQTPGQPDQSGNGAKVTMPAGASVTVTAPWTGLTVTPSFSMNGTFTNDTSFSESVPENIHALAASGKFGDFTIDKQTFLGKTFSLGPVYNHNIAAQTATQNVFGSGSPLGLGNSPNHWNLSGFNSFTEQAFNIAVGTAPHITSAAGATFTTGQYGSFTVTATGKPTVALSVYGGLPAGVTFSDNGNGTATLAGIPRPGGVGSHAFTVTAENVVGSATQDFSLAVRPAPTVTRVTASVSPGAVGQPLTYTATVAPAPDGGTLAFSDNGAPISGCGQVAVTGGLGSCTAKYASPGSQGITVAYSGDASYVGSTSGTLAVAVNPAATRVTLSLQRSTVMVGDPVTVSGAVYDPYGKLVAGASVHVAVSGTAAATVTTGTNGGYTTQVTAPGTAGPYPVTAMATVADTPVSATQMLVVTPSLAVATNTLPGGTVGTAYPATSLTATGGIPPYTWSVASGALPAGLRLQQTVASAVYVEGTPTLAGNDFFTLQVADSAGHTASRGLALYVVAPGGAAVTDSSSASTNSDGVEAVAGGSGTATPQTTATATGGTGTVTTAQWNADPEPRAHASFTSGASYFDVAVSSGSTFTGLTLTKCGLTAADTIDWWTGAAWLTVRPQRYASGCITATLNTTTSSPTIAELGGTPFVAGATPAVAVSVSRVPIVASLQPASGPGAGGTAVTITGLNLSGATAVNFGSRAATSLTVDSNSAITAVSPAGSGTVDVTVTTTFGTSAKGAADHFTYTVPVAQTVASATPTFSDVPPSFWAYGAIRALAGKGIINGLPDGTFEPSAPVTRAEFVKMLALAVGLKPATGTTPFTDVAPAAWYAGYVTAALRAGIVQGESATSFAPNGTLTREQMALMLARALKLTRTTALNFSDNGQIDGWALSGVEEAFAAGYIHGFPDGSFRPLGLATRAQAASVLASILSQAGAAP